MALQDCVRELADVPDKEVRLKIWGNDTPKTKIESKNGSVAPRRNDFSNLC